MTTETKLRSRMAWPFLTALSVALVGCNSGAPDVAQTRAALEVTPAPTPPEQQAAGVELYVQSPFDFETGELDLNWLDYVNDDPVVSQTVRIPYDDVEKAMREKLAEITAQPLTGEVGDGPRAIWTVTLSVDARFSQRGQPVLTPWGSAEDNGVRVTLDNQLEVNLNAHVNIHTTAALGDPDDFDIPMHALIGGHGHVNLAFFPTIRADGLEAWATLDDANVDIEGLDGTAIKAGAVIGGVIGFVTGGSIIEDAFLGAITGEVVVQLAKDQAKDMILKKTAEAFESSRKQISDAVNKVVQPKVAQANALLDRVRSQPIPGVGKTLGELENELGMSLDIRSVTQNDIFRTAITARFANVPDQGTISGRLRFPKRRCTYGLTRNEALGDMLMATDLVDANTDMANAGCSGVDVAGLLHRVYYGANPDAVLQTGAPENNLQTWGDLGSVQVGAIAETPDSYECPFTITGLPDAAFTDLRPAQGSGLWHQISNRTLIDASAGDPDLEAALHAQEPMGQGRFMLVSLDGVSVVLDHTVTSVVFLDIGSHAPASLDECPMIPVSANPAAVDPGFDPHAPTPENCPKCGAQVTPGSDASDPASLGQSDQGSGDQGSTGGGSSGGSSSGGGSSGDGDNPGGTVVVGHGLGAEGLAFGAQVSTQGEAASGGSTSLLQVGTAFGTTATSGAAASNVGVHPLFAR